MNSDQVTLVGQVFESYVSEYHKNDILLILKERDEDAHYAVVVNAMTLFETNMEIGEYFNAFPNEVLTIFDNALRRSALTILQSLSQPEGLSMKQNLHARISGLPVCPELVREHIPKTKDVGHFLSVTGTVIRTSLVKILEFERDYMCNKCKHVFVVQADFEQYYTFFRPSSCPSLENCDSSKFTCLSDLSSPTRCRDYQEIKIQEQVQRLSVGSIPRSMQVVLEDDLVDSCKSGDDITIYGVVMQRWKPFKQDVRCEVEIVLKANYVQVNNEQSAGVNMDEEVRKEFEDFWEHYKSDPFAGFLVCKLNTRTTVLAAANPKGQYDAHESVSVNIALSSPLLSRFDLILVLLDTKNEDWDRIISSFILENKGYPNKSEKLWSMEKMKSYFCLIRKLQPTLSNEGNQVLLRYYQMQRQSDSRNAARTTIRLLESLIRLAEAHARLMFRDRVTLEDAVTVVSVMESSMQGGALLGGVNALHTSFPENPLGQYQRQCELILEKLELPNLLSEELRRLERLQNRSVDQFQPQAVEAEMTPGSLGGDTQKESNFRTLTQQEGNCSALQFSIGGSLGGSPLLGPPSHLGPKRPTSRKHSEEDRNSQDDSLDWFDSVATHLIEPNSTALVSPSPKTSRGLKICNNRSQGKEEREAGQRSKLETEPPPAAGETEAPLRPDNHEGERARKAATVSESAVCADEPNLVLTHHVPRKLHKLHRARARELCRNPARPPSQPTSPSHPQPTPIQSPESALETPKRKRQKSRAQAQEPHHESVESLGAPVAKLAKFTFKQKSKLTHSPKDRGPGSPGTSKPAVQSPETPQRRAKGAAALPGKGPEKPASPSRIGSSAQPQDETGGVSRQPPYKDRPGEKREHAPAKGTVHPELELGDHSGSFRLASERVRKEEVSCSNKSSKVHACTLARLANFSFTSPSESKSESPPPPESKNPAEGGPSCGATATALGRKRKTFQLDTSTEKLSLSKTSLFTLPELDDEPLDFDWDEEMRKKP
ncbi:hypothetical protein FD754_011345 [Muntiacus muntjak]|uniref:DNA helicase MCM9 n=1 Tax=Muntiacus muntjak TaxID=9888 RepID=A0A5N3VBN0_MUNMU|nr:hypothetical protein FD754_011345 [Muntiacus muntjak]